MGRNLTLIPPAERTPLAEITGPDLEGDGTLSSKAHPGKVVVVNVWGSWCPPCRAEAADLQAASVETAEIAQFIGVTSRDRQTATARKFVQENKITYPSTTTQRAGAAAVQRRAAAQRDPVDDDPGPRGSAAVRVLGPISKITLVQMIDTPANGK